MAVTLVAGIGSSSCQTNSSSTNQQTKTIRLTPEEFEQKLRSTPDAQLVDVRTPDEFSSEHLANALNIDWEGNVFDRDVQHLDKHQPLFLYCLSGGRSSSAAAKLQELGFNEVYELKGGMMSWNRSGKPIEAGADATAKDGMTMADYETGLRSDKLVLTDFYAPWCAPCKKMAPMLEELAVEYKNNLILVKINADENKNLTHLLNIGSLPTLILYKEGKVVWKHEGYIGKDELVAVVKGSKQ